MIENTNATAIEDMWKIWRHPLRPTMIIHLLQLPTMYGNSIAKIGFWAPNKSTSRICVCDLDVKNEHATTGYALQLGGCVVSFMSNTVWMVLESINSWT